MRAKSSYSRELMQKLSGGNIYDVLENKKETLYWGVKKGRVTEINTGDLGRTQGRQGGGQFESEALNDSPGHSGFGMSVRHPAETWQT